MQFPPPVFRYISAQPVHVQVFWIWVFSTGEEWWVEGWLEPKKELLVTHYHSFHKTFNPDWEVLEGAYLDGVKELKTFFYKLDLKSKADSIHVLMKLNELAGTNYAINGKKAEANIRIISARLHEGYTKKELFEVVEKKVKEWKHTDMAMYLRPGTLFQKTKIQSYLNQPDHVGAKPTEPTNRIQSITAVGEAAKQYNG